MCNLYSDGSYNFFSCKNTSPKLKNMSVVVIIYLHIIIYFKEKYICMYYIHVSFFSAELCRNMTKA